LVFPVQSRVIWPMANLISWNGIVESLNITQLNSISIRKD